MITMTEIRTVVLTEMPYDTGFMYANGTRFFEDATKFSIIYDGNAVPYIPYQEYGFTHYKSGKFITVNQGFIQDRTVNTLNSVINQTSKSDKSKIMSEKLRTIQARNNMISQGTLQSLKGNNR